MHFVKPLLGGDLTAAEKAHNNLLQHYRGRNEHLIRETRVGKKIFAQPWRGCFSQLSALARIAAHMTGLQERMKGPRYDVYGPWPVVDDYTFRTFPKV